jgi:hypothetical protein
MILILYLKRLLGDDAGDDKKKDKKKKDQLEEKYTIS